eukprot:jgi/Ulvmu1/1921/UM012_0081.1
MRSHNRHNCAVDLTPNCTVVMGAHCRMNEAATRNTELNLILARTDYASAALRQKQAQIQDAEHRLRQQEKLLRDQQHLLVKLTEEHSNIEEAVIRRLAQVFGDPAHAADHNGLERHEIEFLSATEALKRADLRIGILEKQVTQLTQQATTLRSDEAAHDRAQAELVALHRHIFAEQPLELPEAPQQMKVAAIKAELNVLTQRVTTQERAAELLLGAVNAMAACKHKLKQAMEPCPPLPRPPSLSDFLQRAPIAAAAMHAETAALFAEQAHDVDPRIAAPAPAAMTAPAFISNIVVAQHAAHTAMAVDHAGEAGEMHMHVDTPRGPLPGLQVAQAEAMLFGAQLSTATHAAQTRLFDAKASAKRQAGVLHAERDALRMLRLSMLEEAAGLPMQAAAGGLPRSDAGDCLLTPRLTPRCMPPTEGPAAVSGE